LAQESIHYERNPNYIFRKVVDELVLVPIRQDVADMDCIYTMNPVGAFIWEKLGEGVTLAKLQAALVDEFDVDPQTATADLREFLQELEAVDAIRRV